MRRTDWRRVYPLVPCPVCSGRGTLGVEKCNRCYGTGQVLGPQEEK